jgi:hypothetical protein
MTANRGEGILPLIDRTWYDLGIQGRSRPRHDGFFGLYIEHNCL